MTDPSPAPPARPDRLAVARGPVSLAPARGGEEAAGLPRRAPGSSPRRVLVVDDDDDVAQSMALILRDEGFAVDTASSAEEAVERFRQESYHLLVTDLVLPGKSGVELTRTIHEACPATAIVLVTGHATVKTAVTALKRGAADYLAKPIVPRKLIEQARALIDARPDYLPNKLLAGRAGEVVFEGMTARSKVMHNVFEKIRLAAQSDATVLITGESGTGKELVARAVHQRSLRRAGPFIAVHTGAIPRDLIASELFGHERGSFTGATERKEGQFELAEGGTIFLDEISTMDERTQINLLRVLETFSYMRVGGKKERVANTRVVAATNRDLQTMVAEGSFREDLFYRLAILNIDLPPLRERREDIALLAHELVTQFAQQYRKPVESLPAESQRLLEAYHWPGNVRELRNVIEQAVLLARGRTLEPELLPQMLHQSAPPGDVIRIPLGATLRDAEREIILRTLQDRGGNKKLTAMVLGISRRSLYNKLAEYKRPGGAIAEDDGDRDDLEAGAGPASGADGGDGGGPG